MSQVPDNPKIYHITHINNLSSIVDKDCLWSDAKRIDLKLLTNLVGMSKIKKRRLEENEVSCYPGTKVGEYVPFYFCPRSIMLYILYRGNHEDIDYPDGQGPIVHLQADLMNSIAWAETNLIRWAASLVNAGASYADYINSVEQLDQIHWASVANPDFRNRQVKERKQAEFLMFESFPWSLVEHIGVFDKNTSMLATRAIQGSSHQPEIRIEKGWYY